MQTTLKLAHGLLLPNKTTKTNKDIPNMTKTSAALCSVVLFLHTACASQSGVNALTEVKQDLNNQLYRECMTDSEKFGYPTSVSGYATLKQFGIHLNVHPSEHCRRAARHIVRRSFTAPNVVAAEAQSTRWPDGKI